tara:strand:- start:421 stop:534 length:114 start_codon:yes stop_codon:yes gene_type:complete
MKNILPHFVGEEAGEKTAVRKSCGQNSPAECFLDSPV